MCGSYSCGQLSMQMMETTESAAIEKKPNCLHRFEGRMNAPNPRISVIIIGTKPLTGGLIAYASARVEIPKTICGKVKAGSAKR